jgi:hypothetical protein
MNAGQIDKVRRFKRIVTQRIGALDDAYLGRDSPAGPGPAAVGEIADPSRWRLGLSSRVTNWVTIGAADKQLWRTSVDAEALIRARP